jgi:hypothetical protein
VRYSEPVEAGFDDRPPTLLGSPATEEVLDMDEVKEETTGVALLSAVVLEALLVAP